MGAIGLQICPPIFNLPSQDDLIDYYQDISDNIDIGIMVYCTQWMPGGLVGGRYDHADGGHFRRWPRSSGALRRDGKQEDMAKFAHIFSVIENGGSPVESHKMGGRGYINLDGGSVPATRISRYGATLESGRYEEAQTLWDKVNTPLRGLLG